MRFELMRYILLAQQQKTLPPTRGHLNLAGRSAFYDVERLFAVPVGQKHADERVEAFSSVCYNHYLK